MRHGTFHVSYAISHCRWLVLGSLVLLLGSTGCSTSMPVRDRQQLVEASQQYRAGNAATAVPTLDRLIRDYNKTAQIGEAYYIRGLCRYQARQFQGASEDFEQGIEKSKRAELIANCRASLAAIAFQQGDWKRAADLFYKAVDDLPDTPPTDSVLYTAGVSMQRAGQWNRAKEQFARIVHKFRNSSVAEDARRKELWTRNRQFFSLQLGAYRDSENASKAVADMRKKGFLDAWKEFPPRSGQPLWVVLAGQYKTYNEAREALSQARNRQPQATIVP